VPHSTLFSVSCPTFGSRYLPQQKTVTTQAGLRELNHSVSCSLYNSVTLPVRVDKV
jgi:hypothetical protein